MRQAGIVSPQFLFERVERLLRFALSRDDAKCPVCNFLPAGEPFIRPSEKNGSSQTAFYHAIDMPTEHFGLFLLRMANGVHAAPDEDKRMFPGEILQREYIA